MNLLCQLVLLIPGFFHIVYSGGTNYDPYRWVISYKKPATLSSTEGELRASFATDGDFKFTYDSDPGTNYSSTTTETTPTFQLDLGKSVPVHSIQFNGVIIPGIEEEQSDIIIRFGDNPTVDSEENPSCFYGKVRRFMRIDGTCAKKKGRYLNIIRSVPDSPSRITISEVAVYKRPLQSLAYKKTTTSGSTDATHRHHNAVNMHFLDLFSSRGGSNSDQWLRIDLDESHFVHELLMLARHMCCYFGSLLNGFDLRIGDSLANDGNSNALCVKGATMYVGEIRSFYCDMFGRYVNINQTAGIYIAEVIINPETTENVAVFADVSIEDNVQPEGSHLLQNMVDTNYVTCFMARHDEDDKSKRITINLGIDCNIAMILIVNKIGKLNQLVGFTIGVGMTNQRSVSTSCVPGKQNMNQILLKEFHCTPDRILGNHVFIDQEATHHDISISEVGVYEETKPKIMDHHTHRFKWLKEGQGIMFDCSVEGYPKPVISWVREKEVIKNDSASLQMTSVKVIDSGNYECWANNTNGFDARLYTLSVTSDLRICVKNRELPFQTEQPAEIVEELQGDKWYKFSDAQKHTDLQFREASPANECIAWLKGGHPSLKDGVVSRQLCIKDHGQNCHRTLNVNVRRCSHYYVYNFNSLRDSSHLKFCMENAKDLHRGLKPMMTSASRHHALSRSTFHTEEDFQQSYECLTLCQIDKRCKSFNFSQKLQTCQLNSGTKKEFPGNFVSSVDYDYYHINKGIVKQEL